MFPTIDPTTQFEDIDELDFKKEEGLLVQLYSSINLGDDRALGLIEISQVFYSRSHESDH